ncbi:MAG: diguanylate cyclase [Gammaproteobacteria bacterium]|nr:diguanylate cyclase [Gammaproteobacteria bacterium]
MKKPDLPEDEPERLTTLRALGILDSPPDEHFDRITRLAKKLFEVPIALISLVDENRQWFKSCIGLNVSETGRDISFCGHAILGSDLFIINNASEDERFADNPLVLNEPYIRFYAGCPLKAPNGQKLGTLCIIDQEPRSFDKSDLEALVDLASMVESEIAAMQLATSDELTGILNRRGFMQIARHSLDLCKREKTPASLIFIDIDNFKPVNDEFGHAEGDRILKVFAEELNGQCRKSDTLARLGGDEFVVLLFNISRDSANEYISRFTHTLEKINADAKRGYDIHFSYGIVNLDLEKHDTIEALLSDGDKLMYEMKQSKQS